MMTNHVMPNPKENPSKVKRKRVIAAVAQEVVSSEDDNVTDGVDICNIIEKDGNQSRQTATSCALQALGETIKKTLLEINEIREKNRDRRHRELLHILKKMVQHENTPKTENVIPKVTNLSNEILNHVNHVKSNRHNVDQDFIEKDVSNSNETASNCCSPPISERNLDHSHIASATTARNMNLIHKITNKEQSSKIKSVIGVKNDNTKKELQKMRAKMLELQRQKMEDRERKKREFVKVTTM